MHDFLYISHASLIYLHLVAPTASQFGFPLAKNVIEPIKAKFDLNLSVYEDHEIARLQVLQGKQPLKQICTEGVESIDNVPDYFL